MKVAITGAAGYIGHRLVNNLVGTGVEVKALVHNRHRTDILSDETDIYVGDVRDDRTVSKLLKGCDAVAHLAKGGSAGSESVNIEATKRLFEQAEKEDCDAFVFSSTVNAHPRIYGDDAGSYTRTKYEASTWLRGRDSELSCLTLYPSRVIGPGDYRTKRLVPFAMVVSNRVIVPPLYRFEDKNYVHVDTVVDAIKAGLNCEVRGDEIVSGETLSNREYFERIASASSRTHWIPPLIGATWVVPRLMNLAAKLGILPPRDYTEVRWSGDSHDIPDSLEGESPVPHCGVDEAIEEAVDWYEAAGLL